MAFKKITDVARENKGVSDLPDSPLLTPVELKNRFDSLGNLAIDSFNTHIDELTDTSAAASIGAVVPKQYTAVANVQAILLALANGLQPAREHEHTHANKETLDAITSTTKGGYDNLVHLFDGITQIINTLSDNAYSIPTAHAVATAIAIAVNAAPYVRTNQLYGMVYPVGSVYSTKNASFDPAAFFGGTWEKISDGEIKQYERTA